MKDFLENVKECWPYILAIVLVAGLIVGEAIYSFKSDAKRLKEIQAYDKEHCVRYGAQSISRRMCICYDDEKCANFVQEIQ